MGHALPTWILVIFVIIVISAPLIREFRKKTDLDERQLQISHFTSHIAYFVFSALLILVIIREYFLNGQVYFYWYILLLIPMIQKMIFCTIQSYGPVKGGIRGIFCVFFRGIVKTKLVDERQHDIGNFSSHIAFYIYLTLTLFFIIFNFDKVQNDQSTVWYMLLLVPIIIKLYVSLFKSYGLGNGARSICYTISGFWLLFVLLSHGFSLNAIVEAGPFLLLLIITYFSKRFPLIGGVIFLILGLASIYFLSGWERKGLYYVILMYSLIPFPIILCSISFFIEFINRKKEE